jgi:hypothetical protein
VRLISDALYVIKGWGAATVNYANLQKKWPSRPIFSERVAARLKGARGAYSAKIAQDRKLNLG